MAKHPKKGRFRPYLKGQIDFELALGTLAPKDLISAPVGDSVTEEIWLSSVKATWTMDEFTEALNQGPIMVGVAHSDYANAEIEEWVENLASWERHDLVGQEVAKRKIRKVGVYSWVDSTATGQVALNQGKPIRTKCGWMLGSGQTVRIWAYNMGSVALATTDPNIQCQGHANLWPR